MSNEDWHKMTTVPGGQAIGSNYQTDSLLGGGAMGQVWHGRSRAGDEVAIKILRPELTADPEFVSRFLQEAQFLLRLHHPNLVGVRDLVAEGSILSIVMDYVPGQDLRHLLRQRGTLAPVEAADITGQILNGLTAVHSAQVVHRDLKPENVLMDTVPRITDFGVARIIEQGPAARNTSVIGTPEYMAPELADGDLPTPQSDLYSVGIMLYELLTGVTPFTGGTPFAVLRRHVDQIPGRPSGIPDGLWALIARLLAKAPSERPATAEQAKSQLEALRPSLVGLAPLQKLDVPPPTTPTTQSTQIIGPRVENAASLAPKKGSKRRRLALIVGAVALFLVIGTVAAFAFLRPGQQTAGSAAASVIAAPTTTPTPTSVVSSYTPSPTPSETPNPSVLPVPIVVGQQLTTASRELLAAGFKVTIKEVIDDSKADSTVVAQSPEAGQVSPTGEVLLTVARKSVAQWLSEMTPVEGRASTGTTTINGKTYVHSVYTGDASCYQGDSWQYDLGRHYRQFSGIAGVTDNTDSATKVRYEVQLDGRVVYTKDLGLGAPAEFSIDLTGVLRMAITATVVSKSCGFHQFSIGDGQIFGLPSEVPTATSSPS